MKILHYIPSISVLSGGIGSFMQLLARDLGNLCELHVVTHCEDQLLELENCRIHYMPYPDGLFSYARLLTRGGEYRKEWQMILQQVNPDIVHINTCWDPMSAKTALWAKQLGYTVVFSPHGMLEKYIIRRNYLNKKLPAILLYQKKAVKRSDIVHVTAPMELQTMKNLGWNDNVTIIPNCVQIDKIQMKTDWTKKKRILFLSRLHVKKGIEFLIEAVSNLHNDMHGYEVTIAGPGEESYVQQLMEMTRRYGVDDIINFKGPVFGDAKWDLYRSTDVFVLPTHSENFGIVVTEALASGTPVITTHGTPWELISKNNCGWWIPIGTEALTKALREYLACTSEELKQQGLNGRKLIEERFSSISVAKTFDNMYRTLAKK